MSIDFIRQIEVFNPDMFNKPVHVIGAGATGSWMVFLLAKMGVKDITVWDFDVIEEHNIPNQMFKPSNVGDSKVDAIKEITKEFTGVDVKARNEEVNGTQRLSGIVFMLTDTMSSRKEIYERAIKLNPSVDALIETRMDFNGGRIYTINPADLDDIREYEKTLYSDEEANTAGPSACGASTTIVATALDIVSHAIWNFINVVNGDENYSEVLLDIQYKNTITTDFNG